MEQECIHPEEYIRQVLHAYRKVPGTTGQVQRPDRALVAQLQQRGVPLLVIENAFLLAIARRLMRPAGSPEPGTIRSLAYFLPVIEEVLRLRVHPDYFRYLCQKIERAEAIKRGKRFAAAAHPSEPGLDRRTDTVDQGAGFRHGRSENVLRQGSQLRRSL